MRKFIGLTFAVVTLIGINASSAHADPPKTTAPAASSAPVAAKDAETDTTKLKDPFRKRFDDLVAGDYSAIKASTGLLNVLFGTYEEWRTWERTILAGMPASKDWAPPAYATFQITSNVSDMCSDLRVQLMSSVGEEHNKVEEICNKRWWAYQDVTGAMLAWAYATQNPTHLTTKDAEAAKSLSIY